MTKLLHTSLLFLFFCLPGVDAQFPPPLHFQNFYFDGGSSSNTIVQAILQDRDGELWVGSSNGLYRYDGHSLHRYLHSTDSFSLSHNNILALYQDQAGLLWVGTMEAGINWYDRPNDQFIRLRHPEIQQTRIWRIVEDEEHDLWMAAREGLIHYDRSADQFTIHPVASPHRDRMATFRAICFDPGNKDRIWLGTSEGLFYFDRRSLAFQFISMPYDYHSHSQLLVMDLRFEGSTLWCGSWGGALLSYDTLSGKWDRQHTGYFNPDEGKWKEIIWNLLPSGEAAYWVTSSQGFGTYHIEDQRFHIYPPDKQHPNAIPASFYYDGLSRLQSGQLAIGFFGGFSIATPLSDIQSPQASSFAPTIQGIDIDNRPYIPDSLSRKIQSVHLQDHQKDIAIHLCWPGYYFPSPPLFEYRLNGYDTEWQRMTDQNKIRYTNLGAGHYQFHYRASVDGKEWKAGISALQITKTVHFWKTPWFISLCIAAVFGLFFFIYRLKIHSIRKEEALKTTFNKKLAEVEMAALRSQMTPHFMFNSLNSIKYYILNEEIEEADKYLTKFSQLMRAVLHNSKSKVISLESELEALRLYVELEALRFSDKFTFCLELDDTLSPADIYIPPALIQPYVENAIWHGLMHKQGPGKLYINIQKKDQQLHIDIEDNGVGRARAKALKSKSASKKKSFGMAISKDRIGLIETTLGITSTVEVIDLKNEKQEAIGTKVSIRIPLIDQPELS